MEVDGWLPHLEEVSLPLLTGWVLADVVRRKSSTAGSLECWERGPEMGEFHRDAIQA